MPIKWIYSFVVLALFYSLVLAVPLSSEFMATPIIGWLNLGRLLFLGLHIAGPTLAFIYFLRQKNEN
jgi:uncharacterized membrane protein (DUF485 family)